MPVELLPAAVHPPEVAVLIASGVSDLTTQNPIEPGSVSPHRTFDTEGFRVRHLAFDADAVLAEHCGPSPIVVIVVEGSVRFTVGIIDYELGVGAILHVAAGVLHEVTAHERSRLIVTLVG